MKVAQLRRTLEIAAAIDQDNGMLKSAEMLRCLAVALRSADKLSVAKVVEKLTK